MSDDISRDELQRVIVKSQKNEAFIFGMLIGALIGGGVALLYAPMKGSDARKAIKEKAQTIEDTFTDLKAKVDEFSADVAKKISEVNSLFSGKEK
jgi:gas vesicle protein